MTVKSIFGGLVETQTHWILKAILGSLGNNSCQRHKNSMPNMGQKQGKGGELLQGHCQNLVLRQIK